MRGAAYCLLSEDSYHEVNWGRAYEPEFSGYAERHELPFLCVRAGEREQAFAKAGEMRTLELKRSRGSVPDGERSGVRYAVLAA